MDGNKMPWGNKERTEGTWVHPVGAGMAQLYLIACRAVLV